MRRTTDARAFGLMYHKKGIITMHLFFTDLDGTLFNDKKQISPKTMEAIDAYISGGNKFIISSGRPFNNIKDVVKRTGLDRYKDLLLICSNGSVVYDCGAEKFLVDLRLDPKDVLHVIDTAEEMGIHCQTYSSDKVVCRRGGRETDYYASQTGIEYVFDEDILSRLDKPPHKALAISMDDPGKLDQLKNKLSAWMEGKLITVFSCPEYLEFVDYRSGKGSAVRYVCDLYGIPASQAYAAGDANNDFSMLTAVGGSIAMINGSDEVKAIASIITEKDNNHDGLADILFSLAKK